MMLRTASYNCSSIGKNMEIVKNLLLSSDIVVLQELMLYMRDLSLLNDIDDNFDNFATVEDDVSDDISEGRPTRGVAVFWRKELSHCVRAVQVNKSLGGIVLSGERGNMLILNVYMPCHFETVDALDNYRQMIAVLEDVIREQNINNLLIVGDLNADPNRGRFWGELLPFLEAYMLTSIDVRLLPTSTFTYLSPGKHTTSWLDHVLCSKHLEKNISNMCVNYDLALYDHFPLCFKMNFTVCVNEHRIGNSIIEKMVNWNKITSKNIEDMKNEINSKIASSNILNSEIFSCKTLKCKNKIHIETIERVFEIMKVFLFEVTEEFLFDNNRKFKSVPGWNENVKKSQ